MLLPFGEIEIRYVEAELKDKLCEKNEKNAYVMVALGDEIGGSGEFSLIHENVERSSYPFPRFLRIKFMGLLYLDYSKPRLFSGSHPPPDLALPRVLDDR